MSNDLNFNIGTNNHLQGEASTNLYWEKRWLGFNCWNPFEWLHWLGC